MVDGQCWSDDIRSLGEREAIVEAKLVVHNSSGDGHWQRKVSCYFLAPDEVVSISLT
jgi:hypothetical protein